MKSFNFPVNRTQFSSLLLFCLPRSVFIPLKSIKIYRRVKELLRSDGHRILIKSTFALIKTLRYASRQIYCQREQETARNSYQNEKRLCFPMALLAHAMWRSRLISKAIWMTKRILEGLGERKISCFGSMRHLTKTQPQDNDEKCMAISSRSTVNDIKFLSTHLVMVKHEGMVTRKIWSFIWVCIVELKFPSLQSLRVNPPRKKGHKKNESLFPVIIIKFRFDSVWETRFVVLENVQGPKATWNSCRSSSFKGGKKGNLIRNILRRLFKSLLLSVPDFSQHPRWNLIFHFLFFELHRFFFAQTQKLSYATMARTGEKYWFCRL